MFKFSSCCSCLFWAFSLIATSLHAEEPHWFGAIGLDATQKLQIDDKKTSVLLAVIDDGFLLEHELFKGMLYSNKVEIANNFIDDDNNGVVDDIQGVDLSDLDSDVRPPKSRVEDYYHGTHTAGLIAQIIRAKLGEYDDFPIKLMLIKAVPDNSQNLKIENGYQGIQYAIDNGALIVNNSWSGGLLQAEDKLALVNAASKGAFVVNTVGNYYKLDASQPANHPAVFGVTGVDDEGRIFQTSNYGAEVDIVAPASAMRSASSKGISRYQKSDGTSVAAPLVSATAALMALSNPNITRDQLTACLKNSAKPMDEFNSSIAGKLGAGLLQVDSAIECANNPAANLMQRDRVTTKGVIGIGIPPQKQAPKKGQTVWTIKPAGQYEGLNFINSVSGDARDTNIEFTDAASRSAGAASNLWSGKLSELPPFLSLKSSWVNIELTNNEDSKFMFSSQYAVNPIDFEKRFCSGQTEISSDTFIQDGSGAGLYADASDCKWLLNYREGHKIVLDFSALDIHASDKLYLFGGTKPLQRSLLAYFTGHDLPKTINVNNGPALLWFVSDRDGVADGFGINVKWVVVENQ